jgi:hypothetical protein
MKATIAISDPVILAVSPPQYGEDPAGRWWGFFQFPDPWRGGAGEKEEPRMNTNRHEWKQ